MSTLPSNMVATLKEKAELKKIPSSKEWIKTGKNYFMTKAGSHPYYVSEYLLGLAVKPVLPEDTSSMSSKQIDKYKEELKEHNKGANNAWGFMFEVLTGSHLESYIDLYISQPENYKLAWDAVVKHFDDQSQAQLQQAYETKIDNITVPDSGDLKTDFDRVVDELEKY